MFFAIGSMRPDKSIVIDIEFSIIILKVYRMESVVAPIPTQ